MTIKLAYVIVFILAGCLPIRNHNDDSQTKASPGNYKDLNLSLGTQILYELQIRTANACDPRVGSSSQRAACSQKTSKKLSPEVEYKAEKMSCGSFNSQLKPIQLGTIDDMLKNTSDFKSGITLEYIKNLGATTVWIMPPFPNNDQWNIPDGCDNLGSPYAVRDYMHVQGSLDTDCTTIRADEESPTPCWGNNKFKMLVDQAHSKGLKVWLDLAFNHFGHNFMLYDYADFNSVPDLIKDGKDVSTLWNLRGTYDENLLHPKLLDTEAALDSLIKSEPHKSIYAELMAKCGDQMPKGQTRVRAYSTWRNALEHEKNNFNCQEPYLESQLPGFYMGRSGKPSSKVGDNLTNNWVDVKFLYHNEDDPSQQHTFTRNREYLFRVMNYYASLGVDGFRLDHTTEEGSGLDANEWRYLINKVDFYAEKRDKKQLAYMAEEFSKQMPMSRVVDAMTDGYVGDMLGRNIPKKGASHLEKVIKNMDRFGASYVRDGGT